MGEGGAGDEEARDYPVREGDERGYVVRRVSSVANGDVRREHCGQHLAQRGNCGEGNWGVWSLPWGYRDDHSQRRVACCNARHLEEKGSLGSAGMRAQHKLGAAAIHSRGPANFEKTLKLPKHMKRFGRALTQPERRAELARIPQVGLLITHNSLPPSACKTSYIKARKKVSLLAE